MTHTFREVEVPENADTLRVDRFLALRFRDLSRSKLVRGIEAGLVQRAGRVLRKGHKLRAGDVLQIFIPGIAPDSPPPPFPQILHEDAGLIVVNKPAGMLCHPVGTAFAWALIGLARARFPGAELVHRLDRDTSGCIALTSSLALNRALKKAIAEGRTGKVYEAICKGEIPWEQRTLTGPIGPAGGVIRIQMAVRVDGKPARTDVTVIERQPGFTRVRCVLHTGRTHQIRVHLADAGFPLLGDRMYGVPPEVFLRSLDHGADATVREWAGAPHHALHAAQLTLPMASGPVTTTAPLPDDLQRWWNTPGVLPHDGVL